MTFPIRSGSISTPQLARLFILDHIPFHSLPLVSVHLSFTTIFVYLLPFHLHGSSTATAITFIPLLPSSRSISFQRLDRILKQLQNTSRPHNRYHHVPSPDQSLPPDSPFPHPPPHIGHQRRSHRPGLELGTEYPCKGFCFRAGRKGCELGSEERSFSSKAD